MMIAEPGLENRPQTLALIEARDADAIRAARERVAGLRTLRSVQVPETSTLTDDEVVVEGSIFRRADLPMVLGNFMRSSDERGREVKQLLTMLTELRPVRDEDSRTLSTHADPSVQVPVTEEWLEEHVIGVLDDESHEDVCSCGEWPESCVTYGVRRPWSHDASRAIEYIARNFTVLPSPGTTTEEAGQ